MAEINKDSMVLLTTSHEALVRLSSSKSTNEICDRLVVLGFACYYLEASISVVIDKLGETDQMYFFFNKNTASKNCHYLGFHKKFQWFYNEHLSQDKKSRGEDLEWRSSMDSLNAYFRNYEALYNFRNDLSHGKINEQTSALNRAQDLRQSAKDIVEQIIEISGLKDSREFTGPLAGLPNGTTDSGSDSDNFLYTLGA